MTRRPSRLQIKQQAGKPVSPEAETDEEMKILAINGIMQQRSRARLSASRKHHQGRRVAEGEAECALRAGAEQFSEGAGPAGTGRARRRQSRPAGHGHPVHGRAPPQQRRQVLAEIYASTNDTEVKRAILNAYFDAAIRTV